MITREYGVYNRLIIATSNTWTQLATPDSCRVGLLIQRDVGTATGLVVVPGRVLPNWTPSGAGISNVFPTTGQPLTRENGRAACESGWWVFSVGNTCTLIVSEIIDAEQASMQG